MPFIPTALKASSQTPNALLIAQSRAISFGTSDLRFVGRIDAPLPALITGLGPAVPQWPALIGALVTGAVLAALAMRLTGRGFSLPLVALLITSAAATPGLARAATTDLSRTLAIALLILALEGFRRLTFLGQAVGGLHAGIAIAAAVMCDPVALYFAAGFAAAAPLVAHHICRDQAYVRRATTAVLLFPSAAALLSWSFLNWRFAAAPFGYVRPLVAGLLSTPPVTLWTASLSLAVHTLPEAPLYLLGISLLVVRRPRAALAATLPLLAVITACATGALSSSTDAALILAAAGIAALPARPALPTRTIIGVIAAAKIASGLAISLIHHR
jgi:hypothetical protein